MLDFWATWCGPCKASFPAMQKAVNKYKNDPDVKFLFLHTWEKGEGDPAQNAKKYIVDNNYTFTVLMDLRDPQTKASAVASAYKVDGIPAKFIIDTRGNIRFSTSGFSMDADKAVEELSNMIEFAKKQ
ncbi:MAG: TlpA disulfide reductase family protein [Bacteroidales bacterium]|nr:TlpA disulfide reductase family protein [Bacteroidales bacterium]MDD3989681.1 TlpA disulfide reductase family protein [Bacteroidales bacterium]MDD4638231.1 TlpA disulfide reductase family protein [Bacteroidales bacterium]